MIRKLRERERDVKCMKKFLYLSGGNLEKFFAEGTCPEKLLYERFLQSTAKRKLIEKFLKLSRGTWSLPIYTLSLNTFWRP